MADAVTLSTHYREGRAAMWERPVLVREGSEVVAERPIELIVLTRSRPAGHEHVTKLYSPSAVVCAISLGEIGN